LRKVMITGGAGFIGLSLARHLLAKPEHGITRLDLVDDFSRAVRDPDLEEVAKDARVEVTSVDLVGQGSLDGFGTDYAQVFHFAAIIGVAHVLERPFDVLRGNIAMLDRVLEFGLQQSALERLVFASTSEVYAGALANFTLPLPTPESAPLAVTDLSHPRTSYMLSKMYGEALCRHSGLPFTILRPHNIYGPRMGMAHVVPELLRKMRDAPSHGRVPVASAGHRRAFCYVADAVEMIARSAWATSCCNEVLNIGNQSAEIEIFELAEAIRSSVGRPDIELVRGAPTSGSPERRCPDMSKAARLTQYEPRVGIHEGLSLTFEWYEERIFSGRQESAG